MHGIPDFKPECPVLIELFECVFLGTWLELVEIDVYPGSLDSFLLAKWHILEVICLHLLIVLQRVVVQVIDSMAKMAFLFLLDAQPTDIESAE